MGDQGRHKGQGPRLSLSSTRSGWLEGHAEGYKEIQERHPNRDANNSHGQCSQDIFPEKQWSRRIVPRVWDRKQKAILECSGNVKPERGP